MLLVADIHSNLTALQAVLADARQQGGFDAVWNMGDTVGYGPEPTACIDLLDQIGGVSVAGNHDWASVGKVPLTAFNHIAATANRWTGRQLSKPITPIWPVSPSRFSSTTSRWCMAARAIPSGST